jgi:hypothetical protein
LKSRDREDAAHRLRVLLGIRDGTPSEVVLDMQLDRLTSERRHELTRRAAELRQELGHE